MSTKQPYFTSKEVSFYDFSLKILRNNFPVEEIKYDDISRVEISKGFLLKNNLLVILLCLGVMYLAFSLLHFGYDQIYNESMTTYNWLAFFFNRGSVISIWGPLLLVIAGLSGIYSSLIRTHIVVVKTQTKKYKLRIREIGKNKMVDQLGQFLVKNNVMTINKC